MMSFRPFQVQDFIRRIKSMECSHVSRRRFVKTALAGATGSLISATGSGARPGGVVLQPRGRDTDLSALTLSDASELVRSRKISPVELTKACLARIEQLNARLNAFITVTADSALLEARAAEADIQRGRWKGPLHGLPIALKDLLDTAGVRTTAASGVFKDRVPPDDAEVVHRLRAAGAVLLGKLNLHEFAYGGSSAISSFGPVRNPWNVALSPGGSSGGSAAAVAAHLCLAAIGTDTGGSIREPAAYCGIVGLKPTYGRVSASGVIPLSWSLDHVGPMTRTVMDAALMLRVIASYDSADPGSVDLPVADYVAALAAPTTALRVGIPRAYFWEGLHPDIGAAMETALSVLKRLARTQRNVAPLDGDATYSSVMTPYTAVLSAEAYAYHKDRLARSPELYQAATLTRIRAGANVTLPEYIESRRQLDRIRHSVSRVFDTVDLLVTPTVPVPPFPITDLTSVDTARPRELQMLRNTRPINMLGLPTISVPCGFTADGLPIGMQITGAPWAEASVLHLAYAYEQATGWHRRIPTIG
jgi:aspartyl-tRNA(Asn)/glutamyl-tRNA(Gln) amidotransferase subunit A